MTTRKQNITSTLKGVGITLVFFFIITCIYTKGTFKKPVETKSETAILLNEIDEDLKITKMLIKDIHTEMSDFLQDTHKTLDSLNQ